MRKHITHSYLLDPPHLVTVALVGCGGTGSQVLSSLAKINKGLKALGHPGIHVTVYDGDRVSESNVGRQLFSPADIGVNKAVISVSRINRFFGFDWVSVPKAYDLSGHNIVITCTDNVSSRLRVSEQHEKSKRRKEGYAGNNGDLKKRFYWLDFGNAKTTGQVVLGSTMLEEEHALKSITDYFDLTQVKEEDQGPSCSLAEALHNQDLFINSTLANLGCNILWKLFTHGQIEHHGLFLNLETMDVTGIKVD